MWTCASTANWNGGPGSQACGRSPRRALEILGLVFGFIYAWPVALAYVFWKAFGYPMPPAAGEVLKGNFAGFGRPFREARAGFGFSTSGNSAFEEYRKAELARLEEERRQIDEEGRAFAQFVEELKRAKDREEFDAFMAKRRAERA